MSGPSSRNTEDGITVSIRPADTRDIPTLARYFIEASDGIVGKLYEGAIPGRETSVIVEHLFTRPSAPTSFANCWIAEADGRIAGGIHCVASKHLLNSPPDELVPQERRAWVAGFSKLRTPDALHILSLCVEPKYRGKGVARSLMTFAEDQTHTGGFAMLTLNVVEANAAALGLYMSLGFTESWRERVVVPDCIEGDILHMTRRLPTSRGTCN